MSRSPDFQLTRNPYGKLVFTAANGTVHEEVAPVRAFPIADPANGIALMSIDGHELAWVDRLTDLPDAIRTLLEEELGSREFMPEIYRIREVSSFATPSTWQVETDRGDTALVLKGEEDIPPPQPLLANDRRQQRHPLPDPRPQQPGQGQPQAARPVFVGQSTAYG